MRILTLGLILVTSLALQSTIFSFFEIAGIKPDLVLIIVIFNALLQGSREGAVFGFVGGLLQDIILGQNVGMNALAKMATGYLVGLTEKKVFKENLLIPIFYLLVATIINESFIYVLTLFLGFKINYISAFSRIILPVAIYNSCLAPFIYAKFYASSTKGLLKKIEP